LELQLGSTANADLIVTSVPHLIMQEGSIQEGDFSVLNNGSLPVKVDDTEVQDFFLFGDFTDRPSLIISQQTGLPIIGPGNEFIFKYNVISSFDDSPFEPVDFGFSSLIFFVSGFEFITLPNGLIEPVNGSVFAQGNGDVVVNDVPIPPPVSEPSTIVLLGTGLLSLGVISRMRSVFSRR